MKKLSVTIGIPAYNEEANIQVLLRSILCQNKESFTLKKIIVICDGSTDKTEKRAWEIAKNEPTITIVQDHKRLGKLERLNQLYKLNKSDLLFLFDADLMLGHNQALENMVYEFSDPQVAIVGANKFPFKAKGFVEKIINHWYYLWYEIRKDLDGGDNIYNFSSAAFALRKTFAKKLYYPKEIYPITKFTYFAAIKNNFKVKFAKDAYVWFRSPASIHDYLLQIKRFRHVEQVNAQYYGNWTYEFLKIPFFKKIKTILKMMLANPCYSLLAIIFRMSLAFFPKKSTVRDGIWQIAKSSKKLI